MLLHLDDGRRLEPADADDAAALAAHWTKPEVRRFLWDDRDVTGDMAAEVIADSTTTFASNGYGLWVIRPAAGALPHGVVGLRPCPLPAAPVELLYSLEPDRWGRGLATRASNVVLDHAFRTLGLPAVAGAVDEGNDRSTRVLERLGMRPAGAVDGPHGPVRYWLVEAPD